jgi:hypothetical protein
MCSTLVTVSEYNVDLDVKDGCRGDIETFLSLLRDGSGTYRAASHELGFRACR